MEKMTRIIDFYRNNVFVSWVMSNIMILLFATIIGSYAYFQSISIIKNEVNKAHQASLFQFQKIVDEKIKIIEMTTSQIDLNSRNTSIMNLNADITPSVRLTWSAMIKDIMQQNVANNWIQDIFIYYKENDIVLTGNSKYDLEELYDFNEIFHDMSYSEFVTLINEKHNRDYLTITRRNDNGEDIKQTFFIQSLPMGANVDSQATVIIALVQDKIHQMLINANWMNEGLALIMNQDNVIVDQTNPKLQSSFIEYDSLETPNQYININNQSMVMSYVQSEATDWKYIFLIPKNVFMKKLFYMRNIIVSTVLICLIIGTLIAYWLSKRNYRPLSNTIKSIEKIKGHDKWGKEVNEYEYIEKLVKKLSDDNNNNNKQLKKHEIIVKNNVIAKLLKGKIYLEDPQVLHIKQNFDIDIKLEDFIVIAFRVEKSMYIDPEITMNSGELNKSYLTLFTTQNVIEEIFTSTNQQCHVVELEELVVAIISFNKSESFDLKNNLFYKIKNAKEFFEFKMGIFLTIGISQLHKDPNHVSHAYKQALEAIEYRILIGDKQIIEYDKIEYCENTVHACYDFISDEQKFINAIKANDFKSAKEILNIIFKNNFVRSIPIKLAKWRMMSIVDLMVYAVQEIDLGKQLDGSKQVEIDKIRQIEQLKQCQTVNQLQQEMNRILIQIDESLQNFEKLNENSIFSRVKEYIEAEYSDYNMNVGFVADEFHMDATYLSRVMKKNTGKSMLEYIHDVRLSVAKKIMMETNMSIKEIGMKVGYINSQTFIRVFKKYEGITPGKYKEIHGN